MVLLPAEFRIARSLKKALRRFAGAGRCELRIDSDFRRVISACATTLRDGEPGTWIVPEMIEAYCTWHGEGRAHSFETWIDGELAGGLYGVSLGRMFFGESMFMQRTDASKIALAGAGRLLSRARHRDDRLPAAHLAPGFVRRPRDAAQRIPAPARHGPCDACGHRLDL